MHHPEALILRRCYPVPVTFADLRAAYCDSSPANYHDDWRLNLRVWWTSTLKEVTGAIDEVYAVLDGREVRVATVNPGSARYVGAGDHAAKWWVEAVEQMLDKADSAGYWERPHEVRLDLQERPITCGEVQRAVMVGQIYVEQNGGAK